MYWERSEHSTNYRKIWERIGREDPYCGTGGPTRAIPREGRFAQPDTTLFSLITRDSLVLDVGCGYGRNSIPLTRVLRCDLVAVDISATMSKTVRESGIPFVLCDLRYLPFRTGQFDFIICGAVLQHLRRPEVNPAVSELSRVSKRSLILMPNPIGPASLFGLIPIVVNFVFHRTRKSPSDSISCPRGYLMNFYFPWSFGRFLQTYFQKISVKPATKSIAPHAYLTDRILYDCN
jgi:ubiquinone/menaquinone biosynthesis C-methylase UbiE